MKSKEKIINHVPHSSQRMYSIGIIQASHACDPGSIPSMDTLASLRNTQRDTPPHQDAQPCHQASGERFGIAWVHQKQISEQDAILVQDCFLAMDNGIRGSFPGRCATSAPGAQ
jgi:hypothetical protein